MKRVKAILAVLLVIGMVAGNSTVAQASEGEVSVTSGRQAVRQLTEAEVARLELTQASEGAVSAPPDTRVAYTVYSHTNEYYISIGGEHVVTAFIECIVYHYDDGKVHLYNRTISIRRVVTYDAAREYGRIVNTDGSLSYTTGDKVHVYGLLDSWDFAIDFRVTPTEASFDCYEIY